jgi:hypothetical protein
VHAAARSPEWAVVLESAKTLFAEKVDVGVARERIQKDLDWQYRDWGVGSAGEDEVRERLRADGYTTLADDPGAPGAIKTAAANQALAVWTRQHLVTTDGSRLDARPDG